MDNTIELTADGRLMRRDIEETPKGLRKTVKNVTALAHQFLTDIVKLEEGVSLSSIFELLRVNDKLCDIYKRNWSHEYVERYEAIKNGEIQPKKFRGESEPPVEFIAICLKQEITLRRDALANIVATVSDRPYQTLKLEGKKNTVKNSGTYWDVTGHSAVFAEDTEFYGQVYEAGSHINYSLSFSFDTSIDLPIKIVPGVLTLEVLAERKIDRLEVCMPIGTDESPPPITLGELIDCLLHEFSFHGGPEETEVFSEDLKERSEIDTQQLGYGMAAVFLDDEVASTKEERSLKLQNRMDFWPIEIVMEHTGLKKDEVHRRRSHGVIMELHAYATFSSPKITAYPAQQFVPGFDTELFRYINAIGRDACDDWNIHDFLQRWTPQNANVGNKSVINGWGVLALPERVLGYGELPEKFSLAKLAKIQRPLFPEGSRKGELVDAFEAHVTNRLHEYEQKSNGLEED